MFVCLCVCVLIPGCWSAFVHVCLPASVCAFTPQNTKANGKHGMGGGGIWECGVWGFGGVTALPTSAGPLPTFRGFLEKCTLFVWGDPREGGGQAFLTLTFDNIVCVCSHWYTEQRKWVSVAERQERQKGRRVEVGGVGDGFHLALFMSQDKASRGQGGTACEEKRELTCLVDVWQMHVGNAGGGELDSSLLGEMAMTFSSFSFPPPGNEVMDLDRCEYWWWIVMLLAPSGAPRWMDESERWLLIMTTAEGSAAPVRVYGALSGVNGKING